MQLLEPRTVVSFLLIAATIPAPAAGQDVPRWRVEPMPVTSVGELDGPEGQLLTNVLAGTVLSDGTLALQNSVRGLFEIRYHARDGRHLRTVSRWGEGPFEFQYALGLHPLGGDSLLVLGRDDRFAVFGPEGEQVREGKAGLLPRMPVLRSEEVDAGHAAVVKSIGSGMPEPGYGRGEMRVLMHDFETGETRPVATIPGRAAYYEPGPGGNGVFIYPAPFGPESHVAGGGGMLWVGDSDLPTIRGYRPGSDRPAVVLRAPGPRREVDRQQRRRMREIYGTSFDGDAGKRWARFAASMEIPDRMPWYGGMEADRDGNLWVRAYEPPGMEGPQRWWVYSREGRLTATVDVPAAALPSCSRRLPHGCSPLGGILEIGDDYLLVEQRGELGVVQVRRYHLVKDG